MAHGRVSRRFESRAAEARSFVPSLSVQKLRSSSPSSSPGSEGFLSSGLYRSALGVSRRPGFSGMGSWVDGVLLEQQARASAHLQPPVALSAGSVPLAGVPSNHTQPFQWVSMPQLPSVILSKKRIF